MKLKNPCKIAILCTGLDSKLRGYETHQRTLFDSLSNEQLDVTLYKRDGVYIRKKEVSLHTPSYKSVLSKIFSRFYDSPLQCQMAFFGVAFVLCASITRKNFTHIMIIEPGLLRIIYKLKRFLPGTPKLVYTHGINDSPKYYFKYCDHIIEVSQPAYEITKTYSKKQSSCPNIWLIPHFIKDSDFYETENRKFSKKHLRSSLGIKTEKVLLHVGVICRKPKRVDYIFEEFGQLPENWTLLLVGNIVDGDLLSCGHQKYGDRLVQVTLPRGDMWIPYSISDMLAFASTEEGFGIVIIEALSNNLPILLPDVSLYRWIVKENESLLYPLKAGSLADKILSEESESRDQDEKEGFGRKVVFESYTWSSVKRRYQELFDSNNS